MHSLQACLFKYIAVAGSTIMLSVVKMLLKGEVGCPAFNSHGNYIVDRGKSWKNHGIVFLNFCGNPIFRNDLYENLLYYMYTCYYTKMK